jgi:phage baseplate assembly protein W
MHGIGPELPLHRDERFGNYSLVTSYVKQVKQNFKNLLLTCPGERMMNPDFGVGLRNFLFEPRRDAISKIRQRLDGQVMRYMPFIKINKVQFNHDTKLDIAEDLNSLSILIEYEVPSLNLATSLILASEDIN